MVFAHRWPHARGHMHQVAGTCTKYHHINQAGPGILTTPPRPPRSCPAQASGKGLRCCRTTSRSRSSVSLGFSCDTRRCMRGNCSLPRMEWKPEGMHHARSHPHGHLIRGIFMPASGIAASLQDHGSANAGCSCGMGPTDQPYEVRIRAWCTLEARQVGILDCLDDGSDYGRQLIEYLADTEPPEDSVPRGVCWRCRCGNARVCFPGRVRDTPRRGRDGVEEDEKGETLIFSSFAKLFSSNNIRANLEL